MTSPFMGRFLLERFAEEETILRADDDSSDARSPRARLQRDRQIVVTCMDFMKAEQGEPPIVPDEHPVSSLGSQVLKLMAATYERHPDYRESWRPGRPG